MKKSIVCFLGVLILVFTCTACVPTETSPLQIGPDFSESTGDYKVEFLQVHNDVMDSFGEDNPFVYITDANVDGNNGNRSITVTASSISGITKEDADIFLSAVLRCAADSAAVQDTRITTSSQDSFGNFYDIYSIHAKVTDADGNEVVSYDIPAGDELPFDPDIETYYEEWEKTMEIYQRNQQ